MGYAISAANVITMSTKVELGKKGTAIARTQSLYPAEIIVCGHYLHLNLVKIEERN